MATFTGQAGKNNTFTGTAAADLFLWAVADLNRFDRAAGAGGADTLRLTSAGALASTSLAGVSGIERFAFAAGGNAITLKNGDFAAVTGARIAVKGGAGNDTVDASRLTGNNAIDVTAGAGIDVLKGGAGNDTFRFAAGNLFGDTVLGGLGSDKLVLTTAGTVVGGGLTKVSGVETVQLAAGGSSLSFTNANFTGVLGAKISVIGGAGNDTIDGALVGAGRAFVFNSGGGLDTLIGGAGADVFRFAAKDLAGDTIRGGKGGDLLQLTTAGELAKTALGQMTGVETITLAGGGNGIALANANFVGMVDAKINVIGGAGSDSVDASKVTGKRAIDVTAGGGNDTLTGGAGDDVFRFLPTDLTAGDTIAGGAGYDTLQIIRPLNQADGTLATDALAHMTGIDSIQLAKTGTGLTLTDANYAVPVTGDVPGSDRIDIYGTTGASVIDAADLTGTHAMYFYDGNGTDAVIGGAGDDVVRYQSDKVSAPGDTFDGGGGNDAIVFERSMDFLGDTITNVEKLIYFNTKNTDAAVTISGANAERIGQIGSNIQDGKSAVFTVQLAAGSTTDLSNVTLTNADAGDAINVVATGGSTSVTLSSSIASFTGSADDDTVFLAPSGDYNANALINGGGGNDTFVLRSTANVQGDTINGDAGDDAIRAWDLADLTGATISGIETLLLIPLDAEGNAVSGNVTATISSTQALAFASIDAGNLSSNIAVLMVKADTTSLDLSGLQFNFWSSFDRVIITGTGATETIIGTSQNDVIHGSTGGDNLSGGGGDDQIDYDVFQTVAMAGGTGSDTIVFKYAPVATLESITVDLAAGRITEFTPDAVDANATDFENADFRENVVNATMTGTAAANVLIGGSAGDTITGGLGADTLTGGGGVDSFVWNNKLEGGDTITDYQQGTDKLVFAASAFGVDGTAVDTYAQRNYSDPNSIADVIAGGADLVFFKGPAVTAAQIRENIIASDQEPDQGLFVIAPDAEGHKVLYYTSSIADASSPFIEIADFGTAAIDVGIINDFILV